MMINSTMAITDGASFHSLAALRTAHSHLLRREREAVDTPEFFAQIAEFLQRGQATGALLDQ